MGTTLFYENEMEGKIHLNAIQSLIRETGLPAETVSSLYESVFARLKHHARIKEYLPILVSREVKDILLHRIQVNLMEYQNDHL